MAKNIEVVICMGSRSDLPVMKAAVQWLTALGVKVQTEILSAHRTPQLLEKAVRNWESRGIQVIIAGAGGAAHLPGMLAAFSCLPVIGVPVESVALKGLDAILSIVQMPAGVPVATVSVNGATNAAILALQILAVGDSKVSRAHRKTLIAFKNNQTKKVKLDRKKLGRLGVEKFLRSSK